MTTTIDKEATTNTATKANGKPKFSFKSWYEVNRDKLAATRKEKYDKDPEYRAKLKEQAQKYRKDKPKVPRKKTTKMTIPLMCALSGCSPHTYRKYCQQKWIPIVPKKIVFNDTHVQLLKALYDAAIASKYLRHNREEHLAPYIKALQQGWK